MTRLRLAHDLEKLGLGAGGATMVHCRMSALGHVVGGAESVVRALLDASGPEGTLAAYTGWQDAPLDTVTLVHHAGAIAEVPGKRRVSYRYPVLEGGERVWRTFSDIDTSEGALPYAHVIGDED